jgi:hypothetical protein
MLKMARFVLNSKQSALPLDQKFIRCLDKLLIWESVVKSLNAELNPIYQLLTLLGARHILHVSRIRVKPIHKPKYYYINVYFIQGFSSYLRESSVRPLERPVS